MYVSISTETPGRDLESKGLGKNNADNGFERRRLVRIQIADFAGDYVRADVDSGLPRSVHEVHYPSRRRRSARPVFWSQSRRARPSFVQGDRR